jgi:hypothetical protein
LKKKNCKVTPSEIVASLKKRSGKLRGKKISHRERTKFACVWYRDMMGGKLVLRLLDEAELYFLLGDRSYTQLISAIQVFFHSVPFKGSGIFEHNYLNVFSSTTQSTANNYKTFEFLSLPPSIDMVEFGNQTLTSEYHGGGVGGGSGGVGGGTMQSNLFHHSTPTSSRSHSPFINWKGQPNEQNLHGMNSYPNTNEKILITGAAHEDILRVKSNQLIRLLESVIQSKILKISFIYYFNTALVPFIVSCENVIIESKAMPSSSSSALSSLPRPMTSTGVGISVGTSGNPSLVNQNEIEQLKKSEAEERNAMLHKFQFDASIGGRIGGAVKYDRTDSDIEVIGVLSSQRHSKSSPTLSCQQLLSRTTSEIYGNSEEQKLKQEISREVRRNSQPVIPNQPQPLPQHSTVEEDTGGDIENLYQERTPNKTEIRSKFGGKRMTMLGNFISLSGQKNFNHPPTAPPVPSSTNLSSPPHNNNPHTSTMTSTILSHYKIGIDSERYPKDSIRSKHYTQPTDSHSYRIKAYSDRIKGSLVEIPRAMKSSKSQAAHVSQDLMDDYQGIHGIEAGGIRGSGLVKKLSHQGHVCWGDYCNLLSSLHASPDDTKEYLHSIGMIKVKRFSSAD